MSSGGDTYWKNKRTDKTVRLALNLKILEELRLFIEKNPDQRFAQVMSNLGLGNCENLYYHESDHTLGMVSNHNKSIIKERETK